MSEMSRTPEHATDDAPASAGVATARRGLLDLLDEMLGKTGPVTGDLPALDLLEQLVGRAQEVVPGAEAVSVSLVRRGAARTLVASDPFAERVDAIQYDLRSGPCIDAAVDDHVYVTGDVVADGRWPQFALKAHGATGLRSVLALRLRLLDESRATAALNVYARTPQAFSDDAVRQGVLFATQCALLVTAHLAHDTATNLNRALESNREIGIATGVVMTMLKVDREQAFTVLRMASQDSNRKLLDIATEVADTGEVPLRRLRASRQG